jgi:hypothetical protein
MSQGFLVSTALVENPHDPDDEGLPFCAPVDLLGRASSDDYYALAEQFIAALDSGGDSMEALGWSGDFRQNMLAANVRLGSIGERTLQLGDWWLRVFDAHNRAYLSIEQFHADGTRVTVDSIPLYKATLCHDVEKNVLTVSHDYDKEQVALIPGISAKQIERLRRMIVEPADNPSAPPSWGRGDIRGQWPSLPR